MPLTALTLGAVGAGVGAAVFDRFRHRRASRRLRLASKHDASQSKTANSLRRRSAPEAEAAKQQRIAASALGLLVVGRLTLPVIGLLGVPLLFYNYVHMLRQKRLRQRRGPRKAWVVDLFDILSLSLALALGLYLTTALLFLMLFTASRFIARTEREAHADFSTVFGELADTAWLLRDDGSELEIPLRQLNAGDVVVVQAGSMIPVDGQIVAGTGLVDQHLLTGESAPAEKGAGDQVLASTLVVAGRLLVRVERQGAETTTGQIARMLEQAAQFKHRVQSRGERIVEKGASRTMLASLAAAPILGIGPAAALTYSGFGYQMRMAAPLLVLNYLRIASRDGALIKDGLALDTLAGVDTVVFDKTGTLTEEVPRIGWIIGCGGLSPVRLLALAASAEQRQSHPIAQAICRRAAALGLDLLTVEDLHCAVGHGLRVRLRDPRAGGEGIDVLIGSRRFVDDAGIALPPAVETLRRVAGDRGGSVIYVARADGELLGALELRPSIRPEARDSIAALHALGLRTAIISGDHELPTRHLARALGIDDYFAETLPDGKAKHVAELQRQGRKVCFIGDGINDAVALQRADVSVSLHGAATIAQDTAAVVLLTPDLLLLPRLIRMARDLARRMDFSEHMNTAFGVACVSGVLVLGMGVGGAILLYCGGQIGSLLNAMSPLLAFRDRNRNPSTSA